MLEERPSKKQKEVLDYINNFINENGFGPSYREVMRALGLKSVSTVATHVDGLITRGLLVKRENSARSLQVVSRLGKSATNLSVNQHLEWVQAKAQQYAPDSKEATILRDALEILQRSEKTTNVPAGSPLPEEKE